MNGRMLLAVQLLLCAASAMLRADQHYGPEDAKFTIVVMDPLAGPLACDCVQGYAQRRYEELAKFLTIKTHHSYRVVWAESLDIAKRNEPNREFDVIIGKDSVIRAQSKALELSLRPLASLTDKLGETTQKGLFVVTKHSAAASLIDLEGCEILFGPKDCDEKNSMPIETLREIDIAFKHGEICETCSVAAKRMLESTKQSTLAAVISSYAAPLLEGCGTIQKGDLRLVGETKPIAFVSAFVNSNLDKNVARTIEKCLLEMKDDPELLKALESRDGFVAYPSKNGTAEPKDAGAKKKGL